jgi:hypothetical protein
MTDYTLTVPEDVYRRVAKIAQDTSLPIETVLLEHLRLLADAAPILSTDEEAELQALHYLSDDALWTIAREQMVATAQNRMLVLMDKNSSGEITADEHEELTNLVERGQQLMLRKSEAAAVLTQRGFKVNPEDMKASE